MEFSASARVQRELDLGGVQSAWAEILALARNPGVINLGQGFPDFEGSEIGRRVACETIMNDSALNQYGPPNGLPALTQALAGFYQRHYGATYDPTTQMVVTASGAEALYSTISAVVGEGDEVIVFEPAYPWYFPWIRLAGGTPKVVTLTPPKFGFDENKFREAFGPRTKAVIFNTPHNPTGHVATEQELKIVAEMCLKHNVIAISDEVYECTIFGNNVHRRLADVPGMFDRTITIGSSSKMFSLTGWRVGWAVGPVPLITAVSVPHNYASYCAPTPLQKGIAAALEAEDYKGTSELFEENARLLGGALEKLGLEICPAKGGYFLVADVKSTGMGDFEYCRWLTQTKKVSAVPMSIFYANPDENKCTLVRFAICKKRETIEKVVEYLTA